MSQKLADLIVQPAPTAPPLPEPSPNTSGNDDLTPAYTQRVEDDEAAAAIQWAQQRRVAKNNQAAPDAAAPSTATQPAAPAANDSDWQEGDAFALGARNIAEIPRGIAHGAVKGVNAALDLVYELGDKVRGITPEWFDHSLNVDFRDGEGGYNLIPSVSWDKGKPKGEIQLPNFSDPETATGNLTSGVGQFLTGFYTGGRMLGGAKAVTTAGKIAMGLAKGAISDFAFFDGQEKNLSDLIQEHPALQNPVNEFLASSPDDGEMEGRFKRAIEGLGLGAMTEGLLTGVKAIRAYRAAKAAAQEAGPEAVQKAVQEIETGQAGMKSLGDVNEPLVRYQQVDETATTGKAEVTPAQLLGIDETAPIQSTAHETGVTGLPKASRAIMESADFTAGKNGDVEAAQRVVDQVWTEKQTQELAAKLDPNKETVFISVPSTTGKNELPNALAKKLSDMLGGTPIDPRDIYGVGNQEAMKFIFLGDRPFSQRGYTLVNPEALQAISGKQVVVVEDILTTGASARQFIGALRKEGIDVTTVAGLMGNPRLDAPPQLISKLQATLRNAGMDVKGRQLAENLSRGEVEAIITRINKTGNANERAEFAAKLRGIYDEGTGEAVGQHPVSDGTGGSERVKGEGAGNAPLSETIPPGSERLEPGQGGAESGHGASQETAGALRDRPGAVGGRGGEQAAGGGGQAGGFYINFSRIDAPEDVKTVMQNMADNYRTEIDTARRGTRTFEQTALSAEQEDAWKILAERRTGQPLNAEQSLAARNLWASSGQKLSDLAGLASQAPTEENLFAFRKMLEVHRAVQNEVIAARTETARALGSWRIPSGPREMQLRQISEALAGAGGAGNIRELADRVASLSQAGMAQELESFVSKSLYATTRDSIQEAWTMALLSGPKTHLVNMTSNATVALGQVFERAVAARIGRVLGDETGVAAGESISMLNGLIGGVKDAFRLAWKAMRTNEAGGWAGKIDLPHEPAISAESWRLAKDGVLGKTVDVLGNLIRLPGRALMAEDEFFKAVGYRAELHAQAYRQATREAAAGQIGQDGIRQRMAELIENPPDNMHMAAVDHATYATFQNAPGDFAKAWLGVTNKFPAMRFITPFVKTPANIFNYAVAQRSPLAPLFRSFREDMAAGGARQQLALARVGTGTTVMLAAADMAFNGHITGGGPASPAEKQALMRTGWQPYSVKVGDRYFSYGRLDPLAITMGIAADLAEITTHMDHDDREVDPEQAAVYFAATIAGNVMSKTYMRGLSDIVDTLANPQMKAEGFMQRFAGSFVPAGLAEIAKQQDPYSLEVNSMLDAMKARIPGLSATLPARRDLWGRAISYRSGLGAVYDALSPIASRRENPEPIDQEMLRNETWVSAPKRQVDFGGVKVDLSRDEFKGAFSRYAQLAGNEAKHPAWGKGCMDYLNDVVTGKSPMSAAYDMRSDGPDGGKAEFIRSTISQYRELARKQLLEEYPELAAYVKAKKAAKPGKYSL